MLTDQRFALLAAEPGAQQWRPRPLWEAPAGQYSYQAPKSRWDFVHRVTFADKSGISVAIDDRR